MALRLIDSTNEHFIKIGFTVKQRDAVLEDLVNLIVSAQPFESHDALLKRFKEREEVMSTAIGSSIAIPHIISDKIPDPILAIGIDKDGIQYDASAGPVKLVFMFIGPAQKREPYLELLVRVSKLLKTEKNRELLINADSPSRVLAILQELD